MKCTIALEVNNGGHQDLVQKYGAKIIAENATTKVNQRSIVSTTTAPKEGVVRVADVFSKGASYIFSNNTEVTTSGLKSLGLADPESEQARKQLDASGANLYKEIANAFFSKRSNSILSPTPSNKVQIIAEKAKSEPFIKSNSRTFLKISEKDLLDARSIVDKEFGGEEETDSVNKLDLYKQGMEFLLISGLYRGFDISVDGTIDVSIIKNAVDKYNKYLKPKDRKVVFASSFRTGDNIVKVHSVEDFISKIDSPEEPISYKIDNSSAFLNAMLHPKDRETLDVYKEATLVSKLVVANKVISVFKDMVPGLKVDILTSNEIATVYGKTFANKKGFIIGGNIVLNQERFTPASIFHEFGHYYSKWLRANNPEVYDTLMTVIKTTQADSIPGYQSLYGSTGLSFSDTDILEEIFVDKLGLKAAERLDSVLKGIDPADITAISEAVEDFTQSFVVKLTKNVSIKVAETGFSLDSTIADIFNIAAKHSSMMNPSSLLSTDSAELASLKSFFVQKGSPRDVFNGLVQRGMIRQINGDLILYDDLGNRVDADGVPNDTITYPFNSWDTLKDVGDSNAFLLKARKYLDTFKNLADVRFSVDISRTDVIDRINAGRNGVELIVLNAGKPNETSYYQKGNAKGDRVTHFLQQAFSNPVDAEKYVLNSMYGDFYASYIDKKVAAGASNDADLKVEAANATEEFLKNPTTLQYKTLKATTERKFEFKTIEGTYLHSLAELYFRALNYSQKIDYPSAVVKDRSLTYFANYIREGISSLTPAEFDNYFHDNFFSYLTADQQTNEYKDFKSIFDSVKTNMFKSVKSRDNALAFLRLVDEKVIPIITKLKGPITIMPEVKLMSEKMGLAGTIDLIVVDGAGRAHIFDYKTKEEGKNVFWDWKKGTNMKGVMGAYKENAMMKASIQTSIYKLMLMELGIDTGQAAVFYVESKLPSELSHNILESADTMRYKPTNIKKAPLLDVSAELLQHFIETKDYKIEHNRTASQDIKNIMLQVCNGLDVETVSNVDKMARIIYDKAIGTMLGSSANRKESFVASMIMGGIAGADGKKSGLKVKLPGGLVRSLDPDLETEEEKIAAIKDILRGNETARSLQSELYKLFYLQDRDDSSGSRELKTNDRETALRALIRGADASSHDLLKLSSNVDFGLDYSSVQMLRNRTTGETRMIIINNDEEYQLKYGTKEMSNLFGKYMTNNAYKVLMPTVDLKPTNYNMRLVKAGLVMLRQKITDPSFTVSMVISNNGLKKNGNVPRLHDVATVMMATGKLLKVMQDNGEVLPTWVTEALKRPELFESRTYLKNPLEALSNFLEAGTGDYLRLEDMFNTKEGRANKDALKKLLSSYDPNSDRHDLIDSLHNFRNSLRWKLKDEDTRRNNDLWLLTDQVIMHLVADFNYNINPKDSSLISNLGFTASKMSNKYVASFNRKINESKADVRTDFMDYKNEHNRYIDALAKEKGLSLDKLGPALFKDSMKEIYKNLYKTDNTDRATAFILKSPDEVNGAAEKGYLKYLRRTFKKFADISGYNSNINIPNGWMPIVAKSKMSASHDNSAIDNIIDSFRLMNMNSALSDTGGQRPIDDDFSVSSTYVGQLPTDNSDEATQYTAARRFALSIDETGNETGRALENKLSVIEDNLENVMDAFAIAALDAHHYKDVSEYGRALYYTVLRYEDLSQQKLGNLIDAISKVQKRVILHQESSNKNAFVAGVNKFATNAAIAGSLGQALLETFTNPMVTTANYMGDLLYGTLFKGVREFSAKSYTEAFSIVSNPVSKYSKLVEAISNTYGITNSDTQAVREMMNKLEKHSIYQSKHLMYVNHLMMETWQKITMVAFMIEQGSFYAHSLDTNGNLVYDEKKDKRFHFANGAAGTEKYRDKQKFYEATKLEMAKQRNGLTGSKEDKFEDRAIQKAWTTFDANHVKELIVEAYSSLDDTSKSLASYYSEMSALTKMRTWLFSKTSRYFQKPMTAEENESAARLVKVIDPTDPDGYRYEWKGSDTEGILYTIGSIGRQIYEHKTEFLKKGTLTEAQKKNVSKLMGDMIIASIMAAAAAGLFKYATDDETKDNELVKLVYMRWMMATSDAFMLKSIYDMSTGSGSMMVGMSVAARFAQSVGHLAIVAPQAITDPNIGAEELWQASKAVLKNSYGPFKTIDVVGEALAK